MFSYAPSRRERAAESSKIPIRDSEMPPEYKTETEVISQETYRNGLYLLIFRATSAFWFGILQSFRFSSVVAFN